MAIIRAMLLGMVAAAFFAVVAMMSRICRPGGRTWQTFAPLFFRAILRILRVEVVVAGASDAAHPVLLVANHVSWLDVLVFGGFDPFAMLAKHEIGRWPIIASFARWQGTVLVDRTRRMQVPAVNRALAERLAAGRSVLFFPEGTTHDGTRRGRFLTSHLACLAEVPARPAAVRPRVQAAALRYSDPAAVWIGDATLLPHLWTILRRPGIVCHVAFGEPRPIEPGYDRKRLARQLADEIEAMLEVAVEERTPSPGTPAAAYPMTSSAAVPVTASPYSVTAETTSR